MRRRRLATYSASSVLSILQGGSSVEWVAGRMGFSLSEVEHMVEDSVFEAVAVLG